MELVERFDVFLVKLDPTVGSEIHKTRPCLVISPDEINSNLATVIVAPMTTSGKKYPSRIPVSFDDKDGFVALDQIRSVSKDRLLKKLGTIDIDTGKAVLMALGEMFAE
ncbi:type II toxin-antitoxin system PemK/MazF family toxin [Chamaesiphon sp. OTE_75_metabat_556]|uniref:type II toxin-antitoxin system PemK/MazF family toxin n=1 Tax=Chamaesiphon sp. OTE_75_metabat_556 TaxID=2964692 RepID=UPI00286B8EB7|nr:type II toxin-antitoxin system PemK/MazF family toxin [Chamaesiphon sp. OTE_75_metabat_556]